MRSTPWLRREQEIHALARRGAAVTWYGRWHAEIEGVHIWLASGRWIDAVTGQGGRLGRRTVQQLLQQCWAREKPLGRWCATLWWAAGSFFELFDSLFDVFAWLLQSLQP